MNYMILTLISPCSIMDTLQADVNRITEKLEEDIIGPIQGYGYKNASHCFLAGSKRDRNARQNCVERAMHPASQVCYVHVNKKYAYNCILLFA